MPPTCFLSKYIEMSTKIKPNKNAGNMIGIRNMPIKFMGLIRMYANTTADTAPDAPRPL
jgi:hypothetical protein